MIQANAPRSSPLRIIGVGSSFPLNDELTPVAPGPGEGQNWRRVAHQLASAYEKRESERQRDTAIAALGLARPTIRGRAVDEGDGDPSEAGIVLAAAGSTTEGKS